MEPPPPPDSNRGITHDGARAGAVVLLEERLLLKFICV